uniref:hypothetical protein n=1 Tax=Acinetobacter baumannii TaxID=470 RepID=UPI001C07C4D4
YSSNKSNKLNKSFGLRFAIDDIGVPNLVQDIYMFAKIRPDTSAQPFSFHDPSLRLNLPPTQ